MRRLCFCLCVMAAPAFGQGVEIYGETTADLSTDLTVESYLEATGNGVYTGVWALAAKDSEIDLYAGFRGSVRGVDYDISFTRYIYPGAGGGEEIALSLGRDIGSVRLDTDVTYEPAIALGSLLLEAEFAARDATTLSARFGIYQVEDAKAEREWGISAEKTLNDQLSARISFADGDTMAGTFTLSLMWESP